MADLIRSSTAQGVDGFKILDAQWKKAEGANKIKVVGVAIISALAAFFSAPAILCGFNGFQRSVAYFYPSIPVESPQGQEQKNQYSYLLDMNQGSSERAASSHSKQKMSELTAAEENEPAPVKPKPTYWIAHSAGMSDEIKRLTKVLGDFSQSAGIETSLLPTGLERSSLEGKVLIILITPEQRITLDIVRKIVEHVNAYQMAPCILVSTPLPGNSESEMKESIKRMTGIRENNLFVVSPTDQEAIKRLSDRLNYITRLYF